MPCRWNCLCSVALTAFIHLIWQVEHTMAQTSNSEPPVARRIPRTFTIHGDKHTDNYYWLREKTDPEVVAYLEAENEYTNTMMKPTESLQETLYKEMLARIKQTDMAVPYREGDYYYYSRTEEGKQYPIYCRKQGNTDGPEQITLDLNELAKGHTFMALGAYTVSRDSGLLAYSTDSTGFRQYVLQVKDLRSDDLLSDRIEKVTSIAWANDNKTLYYVTEDAAKRPYRLYRHVLGNPEDTLLYEETDELFRVQVSRSRSRAYIFLTSESATASEVRFVSADSPAESLQLVSARDPEHEHEYYLDHHGEFFYIRTNDKGKNFRLVRAPVSDPRRENWKQVVRHRNDVMLEGMSFFAQHYVLTERKNGLPRLRVIDLRSDEKRYIRFPEKVYVASAGQNPEFDTTSFRYNYQSFLTPSSIFEYDMLTGEQKLLKQIEVLGDFDSCRYRSERIYATADDGVRIPISLVYRKTLKRDGSRPMLLSGYGSYGFPSSPTFSSSRLSLLDRGVIIAIAHIRGGGEMGKQWHDQGKMMSKKNTFTDFIASAEHLIAKKYTSPERLIITGGSAGGLLMGAVVNMRPELFHAVVSYVPFVDVINTMLDSTLPLTIGEYLEWGNPNIKDQYDYMKSYCPYTNLSARKYPVMLIRTSLNDSQVMYWEPAKYVAKLRALKTDNNLLLLRTNMGAGHGGASGRYDALRDTAFDYAFILQQSGR